MTRPETEPSPLDDMLAEMNAAMERLTDHAKRMAEGTWGLDHHAEAELEEAL